MKLNSRFPTSVLLAFVAGGLSVAFVAPIVAVAPSPQDTVELTVFRVGTVHSPPITATVVVSKQGDVTAEWGKDPVQTAVITNGKALLASGALRANGTIEIVGTTTTGKGPGKKHKHKGHVTILK